VNTDWDDLMTPWRALVRTRDAARRRALVEQAHAQVTGEDPLAEPGSGRWVIAGDVHANAHYVTSLLDKVRSAGLDRLLVLGDFAGTLPDRTEGFLDWVSYACHQNGVTLLWLDGNHEPHREGILDRCPVDPRTGTRPVRPRVHHLPRGLRWTWGRTRYAAAGGAVSVDRAVRTEGQTVFTFDEELTESQVDAISAGGPCDVLLTHDRPAWVELSLEETPGAWWQNTPGRWADGDFHRSQAHQARLDRLVAALRPRWHLHGHLHRRYDHVSSRTPWGGPCLVSGLANEGQPYGNRIVVDTQPDLDNLDTFPLLELR
jgi:hypothetical protein